MEAEAVRVAWGLLLIAASLTLWSNDDGNSVPP